MAKNAGNLEVRMYSDYYPYGMTIQSGGTNYRYQYQGQYSEKDAETDWNAFELRMYDSRVARWLSVDPKGEFHSPYLAMGNSPTGKTDPDGGETESPIFDMNTGDFLGTDSDGFQGEMLFMSKDQYNSLSKNGTQIIDHGVAMMSSYKIGFDINKPFDKSLPFNNQTAKVLGNAFSYVVGRMSNDGINVGSLHNGKVSTYGNYSFFDETNNIDYRSISSNGGILNYESVITSLAAYSKSDNMLTYNLNYRDYLNTVENVQNLAVHEFIGHKIKGYDASVGKHAMAYDLQMRHPTFNKTTPAFQNMIRSGRAMY